MGISKKERERIEKFATDENWLDRQTAKYEIHYQTEPPVRTDQETDQGNAPKLSHVYQHHLESLHSHAEMHQFLVDQFGLKCWGCNFEPPDKHYLYQINPICSARSPCLAMLTAIRKLLIPLIWYYTLTISSRKAMVAPMT